MTPFAPISCEWIESRFANTLNDKSTVTDINTHGWGIDGDRRIAMETIVQI